MSTKAIEEALDYLENNPTAEEAQDAMRRARAELEALRKAAKQCDADDGNPSEDSKRLLASIAKESR
jgi:hypothetical protein